jgi:hypothetical protein
MKDDAEAPLCFRNSASLLIVQTHHFLICETAMYVLARQFRISGSGKKFQYVSSAILEMTGLFKHGRSAFPDPSASPYTTFPCLRKSTVSSYLTFLRLRNALHVHARQFRNCGNGKFEGV